jgi:O-antigen/teichoic acid export membrane protein
MIFPNLLKVFVDVSNKLFIPRFSKFDTIIEVWNWFKQYFIYIIGFYVICGVVGFYSLEYIIEFFFSEKYSESSLYGKWMFLSMALAIPAAYLSQIMIYQKKTKYVYVFTKVNVIVKMLGFTTLLPVFGLWGMVYTLWINMLINNLVMGGYFFHYIRGSRV